MNNVDPRISVSIITGFLGSGKTTLLNRLLHHPAMEQTAVIVNEFGEIGIDHELIQASNETTILLGSGCLCCTVKGDLVNTLGDLSVRRLRGEVPPFARVVIETSGLADPTGVIHALMSVPVVNRYRLDSVITTVDAVNAVTTLRTREESVRQAAIADRLVVTKTDLVENQASSEVIRLLHSINANALVTCVVAGDIDPHKLLGVPRALAESDVHNVLAWLGVHDHEADDSKHEHEHHLHGIASYCMTFDESFAWPTLARWLDSLVVNHGEALLRIKGIVDIQGVEEPVVIHAVQRLFHPPTKIRAWSGARRCSRLVFITNGIPRATVEAALRAAMGASPQSRIEESPSLGVASN
jgi:G3E family GTPase